MKYILLIIFCLLSFTLTKAQTGWQQINNFGTNPGNLNMYIYVPVGTYTNPPVVVVLHGCSQDAATFRDNSGWNQLADIYKFIVVYPEQNIANNSYKCFNWFLPADQERDAGEALSIKQMTDYAITNHNADSNKIYVTGLSAGAGMSAVMLACYPDVFNAGAIMAGVPYKAASDAITASNAMYGFINKTPQEWAALATNAYPQFSGNYPRISIFHGLNDMVVSPVNITELTEQWTAVHNVSQNPDLVNSSFNSNSDIEQSVFLNNQNDTVVLVYRINNMGHAIAVDPGSNYQQGGTTGTYSIDKNFFSSYWAARFFGLLSDPLSIDNAFKNPSSKIAFTYFISDNEITINIDKIQSKSVNLRITDVAGKTVFLQQRVPVHLTINKDFFTAGIYYCVVSGNETSEFVLIKMIIF